MKVRHCDDGSIGIFLGACLMTDRSAANSSSAKGSPRTAPFSGRPMRRQVESTLSSSRFDSSRPAGAPVTSKRQMWLSEVAILAVAMCGCILLFAITAVLLIGFCDSNIGDEMGSVVSGKGWEKGKESPKSKAVLRFFFQVCGNHV